MANTRTTSRPAVKPASGPRKPEKAPTLKTPVDVYFLLMKGGSVDFVIHKVGCKAYKAQKAKSQYAGLDDYGVEQVVNQRDVIMEVWDEQIRETYADDEAQMAKSDDYTTASWAWLRNNGYVDSVSFHTCLDGLPQSSKAAAAGKSSETIKKATKTELATRVAEAAATLLNDVFSHDPEEGSNHEFRDALLAAFGSEEAARQCCSQWMHGMPVDRDRWYYAGLPIPQRSDWADYQPPADAAPATTPTE